MEPNVVADVDIFVNENELFLKKEIKKELKS
jgi:hypothetical protein